MVAHFTGTVCVITVLVNLRKQQQKQLYEVWATEGTLFQNIIPLRIRQELSGMSDLI